MPEVQGVFSKIDKKIQLLGLIICWKQQSNYLLEFTDDLAKTCVALQQFHAALLKYESQQVII